jgi:hypothetical protein
MQKFKMLALIGTMASAAPAFAEEGTCSSQDQCAWSILGEYHTEAEYIVMNKEIASAVIYVEGAIVGSQRDDEKIADVLANAMSLCAAAKCKSQKSVCGQIHQLAGLHGYIRNEYVPALQNLATLDFSAASDLKVASR